MDDPVRLLVRWLRWSEALASVAALAVGMLSAAAPQRSIALYQWIMARCNWRVTPMDEARERRNTRVLGLLLVLLSLALLWCAAAPRAAAEDVSVQVAVRGITAPRLQAEGVLVKRRSCGRCRGT